MEQTGHQQYEKKKKKGRKERKKYTSVEACSAPHHPAQRYTYASENQAKQSLQNDKKTVYMFSNIFVLYYIQLSLLKMEYR